MRLKAELLSYSTSFFYNVSISMYHLLIPLYALYLEYSPFMIGIIIAIPSVFQVLLRLVGGFVTDRVGEKMILLISFGSAAAGLPLFALSHSLFFWVAAQLLMGISRSIYWSASQSYTSRIDESRTSQLMGRLNSVIQGGQIIGLPLGGLGAGLMGYPAMFIICGLSALASLLLSLFLPELSRKRVVATTTVREGLALITGMFRVRILYLAGLLSFIASHAYALFNSFYPIYFESISLSEAMIGFLNSVRPVGGIAVGLMISFLLSRLGSRILFGLSMGGTGLLICLTPLLEKPMLLTLLMFVIGITSGSAQVQYQIIASENSPPEKRALSLSFVGLFWATSMLITPIVLGGLIQLFGIAVALWVSGASMICLSLLTRLLFNLLAAEKEQPSASPATR